MLRLGSVLNSLVRYGSTVFNVVLITDVTQVPFRFSHTYSQALIGPFDIRRPFFLVGGSKS